MSRINSQVTIDNITSRANVYTPIIDAVKSTWTNNSVEVGYVYGGIEAYLPSPGALQIHEKGTTSRPGYGKGFSGASGKIWKVTLKRTALGRSNK